MQRSTYGRHGEGEQVRTAYFWETVANFGCWIQDSVIDGFEKTKV